MSDIRELMEAAADKLTRNERALQPKKENPTEAELQQMLVEQTRQKNDNRDALNKKLVAICLKAKEEFNLSSVPTNMMQKVAQDISNEIESGNITGIENVESNKLVVATVQREATKVQLIENFEAMLSYEKPPHGTVPLYVDSIKYIASDEMSSIALTALSLISDSEIELRNLASTLNENNFDEVIQQMNEIVDSKKYKESKNKQLEAAAVLLESDNPIEQNVGCLAIETTDTARVRLGMTPEEKMNDKAGLANLLNLTMAKIESGKFSVEAIVSDMQASVLLDDGLSKESRLKIQRELEMYLQTKDSRIIMDLLASEVLRLNPNLTKEAVMKAAKDYANAQPDAKRIDKNFLKEQLMVRISDYREYGKYSRLVDQIFDIDSAGKEFDWQTLHELEEKSPELYGMTLRALKLEATDKETAQIVEGLIDDAANKRASQAMMDRAAVRQKINQELNVKESPEAFYRTFAIAALETPDQLKGIKENAVAQVKRRTDLSENEKATFIADIEAINSKEDVLQFSVNGITDIKKNQGKDTDSATIESSIVNAAEKDTAKKAEKAARRLERDACTERAAIILTVGEYEKFLEITEKLRNSKTGKTLEVDTAFLDSLKEIDGELYKYICNEYKYFGNDDVKKVISKRELSEKLARFKEDKARESEERAAEDRSEEIDAKEEEVAEDMKAAEINAETVEKLQETDTKTDIEAKNDGKPVLTADTSTAVNMTSEDALVTQEPKININIGEERE